MRPRFSISRWWRSRGFGIHSPFAYRFITAVLYDSRRAYYAYADFDSVARSRRERKSARRAYRVAADLDPADIVVAETVSPAVAAALRRYRPSASASGCLEANVDKAGRLTLDYVRDRSLPSGCMVFRSPHECVSVSLPELTDNAYTIYFR